MKETGDVRQVILPVFGHVREKQWILVRYRRKES
jgi:hypothetical protein